MATATTETGETTLEDLMARAEALVPVLRQRAESTHQQGRVSDETIRDFKDAGFFRAFVPKRYGGYELDYGRTQVELCNQIGRACASSAWVLAVVGCHPWLLGMLPDVIQSAVWSTGPDTLLTTAVSPSTGKIRRVPGGYKLEGTWQFSSGVDAAEWIMFGAPLDGEKTRAPWCVVPKKHWQIDHESWHPAGLRGTGSKDVHVEAFVPEEMTCAFGARPSASLSESYIYRLPLVPLFYYNVACPALGVARGAVESFVEQVKARPSRGANPGRQMRLAESSAEVDAALALMRADAAEIAALGRSEVEISRDTLLRWERNIGYSTQLCVQATNRLLTELGAHGIDESNPVHRAGRDIQAIGTHAGNWDARAVNYARAAFGLEPERGDF
jgi:3-hydroxy-9,10-secoandrosta-1,3,5(10)-triene-9,17-dione monooxygenase